MAQDDQYFDEEQAEDTSDGMGTGLVVITSIIMIAAFIVIQMALKDFGRGLFFKG